MRRLDERVMLEHAITTEQIVGWQLDRLADALVRFYRKAIPAFVTAEWHLVHWWQSLSDNRRILLDARLGLPAGLVRHVDHALRRFLVQRSHVLPARVRARHLVDGYGDFPASRRPDQIWLREDAGSVIDVSAMPAYRALRKSGLDTCGLAQLASRTAGVPFVGLIAAALAVSELLRRLHGHLPLTR